MSATMEAEALKGGFANPVFESQSVFRGLMDALARPGSLMTARTICTCPSPLSPRSGDVALTLCDADTAVWLDKPLRSAAGVSAWLSVQTGAFITAAQADADFAFIAEPEKMPPLEAFAQGTPDYPDRSTTLILQVGSLSKGQVLELSGPGIETVASVAPKTLPMHFLTQWRANRERFPRGVDIVLVGSDGLVGLPRTVSIEPVEG